MASVAANVDVAVTGLVSVGPTSSTAPTSTGSTLTGFADLGFISEDGVVVSQPDTGDSTPLKVWQNGATVRILRSLSDDVPTIQLTMVETKLETVQTYFDTTATQNSTDGAVVVDTTVAASHKSWVIDAIDGSNLIRLYIPYGIITAREDITFANQEAIGYGVTISAERSATTSYNMKAWFTQLHS